MVDDAEAQNDELIALESIFEDQDILKSETVNDCGTIFKSGKLTIQPNIENSPINFTCKYAQRNESSSNDISAIAPVDSTHQISYLPPVNLNFIFPSDYPSRNPPKITLTCVWLDRSQLSNVCGKLDEIWEEQQGQEILYTWFQFLQEDLLNFLGLAEEILINQEKMNEKRKMKELDHRVMQDVGRFSDILPFVLEYDEMQMKKAFDNTIFDCNVCFSEKYGKNCIQFKDCGHVYCVDCIKSYFDLQIKEGNMKALICPEHKCDSQAYPAQIKELVSNEDFERYEKMLFQTTLDTMNDIMYCPRKSCQSPVVVEPDETIGICSVCTFSFCPFCKLAYHGIEPCRLKQSALRDVCEKYKDGDDKTRKELETKYGSKILRLTMQNLESEKWLTDNSKNCPGCGAAIEKKDGCNKMTCYKCKCYFCWLCMRSLSLANPYDHYNTMNSRCFNKLFQGVDMNDDLPDDMDWFW
ncbi:E3 ubiquitin-protein ligase RNF14-like [Styela clava]